MAELHGQFLEKNQTSYRTENGTETRRWAEWWCESADRPFNGTGRLGLKRQCELPYQRRQRSIADSFLMWKSMGIKHKFRPNAGACDVPTRFIRLASDQRIVCANRVLPRFPGTGLVWLTMPVAKVVDVFSRIARVPAPGKVYRSSCSIDTLAEQFGSSTIPKVPYPAGSNGKMWRRALRVKTSECVYPAALLV